MHFKKPFLFFLVFYARIAAAQDDTISGIHGRIYDSTSQQALQGVSLYLPKSKLFTLSKADGSFSFPAINKEDSLIATFTGYTTYRMFIAGGVKEVIINMGSSVKQLEEVTVNTGYERVPKERSTGSFNVISNQLINRSVSTDILSRIENLTPGILFNHGDAGKDDALIIRGRSTIYANASPLIVVDNFPYDGDINNINPNDIETISILKDAAAASIWGARAGNGVIVITTKKGRTAKPGIELNVNTTVTGQPDLYTINQVSGSDYAYIETWLYKRRFYNWIFKDPYNSAAPPVATLLQEAHIGNITQEAADAAIDSLKHYDVRNDLEKYFYRKAIRQQYAFNVSGKTEKSSYYLSAGYDHNTPSFEGSRFDRISIRSMNSYQATKRLELNAGINYTQTNSRTGNNEGYDYYSLLQSKRYTPYTRLADANGNALPVYDDYSKNFIDMAAGSGQLADWTHKPLADINEQVTSLKNTDYLIYAGLNLAITNGLHIEGRYQYESENTNGQILYNAGSYYARNLLNNFSQPDAASGNVKYIVPKGGIRDASTGTLISHQGRVQADLNKEWEAGRHQLTAIAGFEIRSVSGINDNNRIYGYDAAHNTVNDHVDFSNYYPQYSNPDYAQIPNNLYLAGNTDHFISYYGNAAYTFERRYTFSGSARIDEANLFGVKTNQKGTPLWSAGAAWQINQEGFYHISWLPVLRMRATYGFNGNISRQATAYTTISYNTGVLTPLPIAFVTNTANPDLRWEKTGTVNISIDFSTRKDILSGSIEFYTKQSTDLIANAPLDPSLGIGNISSPSYFGNVASMKGKGIDVQLTSLNVNRQIQWRSYYILSYTKTKVTGYSMPVSSSGSVYIPDHIINPVTGKPLFSVYSYPWAGLNAENGNPMGYLNGKPSEDYRAIYSSIPVDSLTYNGPAEPTVYGALRNEVSYKNFSLSFNISYKLGYYFRTYSVNYEELFNSWNGNGDFAKRWRQPGDEQKTHVPSMIYPDNYYRDYFYKYADVLVAKADNIRLEDISVSYEISKQQYKKLPAERLKLFIYASNLGVLWRANNYGMDPYYNNTAREGKSIAIGLNVIF